MLLHADILMEFIIFIFAVRLEQFMGLMNIETHIRGAISVKGLVEEEFNFITN